MNIYQQMINFSRKTYMFEILSWTKSVDSWNWKCGLWKTPTNENENISVTHLKSMSCCYGEILIDTLLIEII